MPLDEELLSTGSIYVQQQKEMTEVLLGFETRNKYAITSADGRQIGFAAEQRQGIGGMFMRQIFGHWRSFELFVFDALRQKAGHALHPFRFFFQRLEIHDSNGMLLGTIERRFFFFTKGFDIFDKHHRLFATVRSPIWKIWSFPLMRDGQEIASVKKKWSGVFKEALTDADNFHVEFSPRLTLAERYLALYAALYVDLMYFERQGRSSGIRWYSD